MQTVLSTSKEDVIKCKGRCESYFHKKCIRNLKSFLECEQCEDCQNKKKSKDLQSPKLIMDPAKSPSDSVLIEINKKLDILFNMKKTMDELVESVEFYAEQYQGLMEFKDKAEKKMTAKTERSGESRGNGENFSPKT